jgi:hypothetical protein
MYRRPYRPNTNIPLQTHCEIQGVEHEVAVFIEYQPEERDTNTAQGVEIESVILEDQGDVSSKMTDDEFEQLEMRVTEEVLTSISDYYEGDG